MYIHIYINIYPKASDQNTLFFQVHRIFSRICEESMGHLRNQRGKVKKNKINKKPGDK